MDDASAQAWPAAPASPSDTATGLADDARLAWERALAGPPINPRSELIYHDRPRHRK